MRFSMTSDNKLTPSLVVLIILEALRSILWLERSIK